MSFWTRNRNAVTGEAEALWFGASNMQKGIVIAIAVLFFLAGRFSKLMF